MSGATFIFTFLFYEWKNAIDDGMVGVVVVGMDGVGMVLHVTSSVFQAPDGYNLHAIRSCVGHLSAREHNHQVGPQNYDFYLNPPNLFWLFVAFYFCFLR